MHKVHHAGTMLYSLLQIRSPAVPVAGGAWPPNKIVATPLPRRTVVKLRVQAMCVVISKFKFCKTFL